MELQELHSYIQEHQPNICQISVLQNGNELYSAEWNGYQRTDCVHIASATKSVMALLIGIAVDRQIIGSVDDKVLSYFPQYSVKRGEKTIFDVTIRHLITMRAPYKGHGDPWTKVYSSEDWMKASLDFLGGKNGVTDEFDYQNKNERTMECGRNRIHRRGKNNHDGKCSVFFARGSAVDLEGPAECLSLCTASTPQG